MSNFYLGSDVSKGYSDFVLINADKQIVLDNFQLDDTFVGHQHLIDLLTKFAKEHPDSTIYSGVESTGGYENNWLNTLSKLNSKINIYSARINPRGTNHNNKASLTRITTDKNAAQNIAEHLINQKKKIIYNKDDKYYCLRRQWKFVNTLTKQRTQLYNQLESLLYIANPELLTYCKDGYPRWLIKVILSYPTAKKLSRAKLSSLLSIPFLRKQRALSLIEKAKGSVASADDDTTANLIISIVKQILSLSKQIDKQSKYIAEKCELREIEILKSFPGIGDYSAVGLLINISSIEYFENPKKLASFFGLHPIWKQSGDGLYGMHMSKQGRKELRAILYMVARTAIAYNPHIKEIYARHLKNGKNKTAALGVCMHKILRMVFGMLKNNEKYNDKKDRAYRNKMVDNKNSNKPISKKLRRYHQFEETAPISKRQLKKRKEQEMSQDPELNGSSTGSVSYS